MNPTLNHFKNRLSAPVSPVWGQTALKGLKEAYCSRFKGRVKTAQVINSEVCHG